MLQYSFIGDLLLIADDPLGRRGPNLDDFLSVKHANQVNQNLNRFGSNYSNHNNQNNNNNNNNTNNNNFNNLNNNNYNNNNNKNNNPNRQKQNMNPQPSTNNLKATKSTPVFQQQQQQPQLPMTAKNASEPQPLITLINTSEFIGNFKNANINGIAKPTASNPSKSATASGQNQTRPIHKTTELLKQLIRLYPEKAPAIRQLLNTYPNEVDLQFFSNKL